MAAISLTSALRQEYATLFDECHIRPERTAAVDDVCAKLLANRPRYEAVTAASGVPWFFIAAVHNMEATRSFNHHLHNGDPLTARTRQVPAGRPSAGTPPFTWEVSCADALGFRGLSGKKDWSLTGTLYELEAYNGWGYRRFHPEVKTPYLWSFSTHYDRGKYVADGTWSDTARSQQCGAAVILRRFAEKGVITFADQPPPAAGAPPLVSFSTRRSSSPEVVARAEALQRWLNTLPGVFVKVDGVPGEMTSNAVQRALGVFLPGDPRAA